MPKRSVWDSNLWSLVVGVGTLLGIISFFLTVLGKVDLWNLVILPIRKFLKIQDPVYYSIALAFVVLFGVMLVLAYASGSDASVNGNISEDGSEKELGKELWPEKETTSH